MTTTQKLLRIFGIYLFVNIFFTIILYRFCRGQISGCESFLDHLYYVFTVTATLGSTMTPLTARAKIVTVLFIIATIVVISHSALLLVER